MSDKNPTAEYFATCTAIAEDIAARCRSGEIDDISDAIHEEVDGNHYVIYTHANLECLAATSNDDSAFDEMGSDALSGCNSAGEVYARLAYHAMRADVVEALRELDGFDPDDPDSWTATPDEDTDEDEDEDEDEERHIVGHDEDGDPILELGPDEPGQVPAQDE